MAFPIRPLKEIQSLVEHEVLYTYINPTNSFLNVVYEGILNSNNNDESITPAMVFYNIQEKYKHYL